MVLTNAQIAAFFEQANNMALPNATVVQLQAEGIDDPEDLTDFDKDSMKQVAENLRNPGGRIPNPDPGAAPGSTIPRPLFVFGAKSQKRLLEACDLIRFYDTIGRPLTAGNIRYIPVIKNFTQQWKVLKDRKEDDSPEVPKVSKALPIIKWSEAFMDYLSRKVGLRCIPLSYVVRETEAVPAIAPVLALDLPHSEQFGSVEEDLIQRASHTHPLFRDDNAQVYYDVEEGLRGTSYLASIKPHQRAKNGRGAYRSIVSQYAGADKWQAELKKQEDVVHNRIWKGQSNFTLDKFVAQHRNAYVMMEECSHHVPYQLPNAFMRVTHLLDNIQCDDAPLQASMALVRNDTDPTGKMNNFEDAASFIIPYDPVAKKRAAAPKRGIANISEVDGKQEGSTKPTANVSGTMVKPSIGKTGVELRFYDQTKYRKLTKEQWSELYQWREDRKAKSASKKARKDAAVSAVIRKELDKRGVTFKETEQESEPEVEKYIMSLIAKHIPENSQISSVSTKEKLPKVTINSILKRAKG